MLWISKINPSIYFIYYLKTVCQIILATIILKWKKFAYWAHPISRPNPMPIATNPLSYPFLTPNYLISNFTLTRRAMIPLDQRVFNSIINKGSTCLLYMRTLEHFLVSTFFDQYTPNKKKDHNTYHSIILKIKKNKKLTDKLQNSYHSSFDFTRIACIQD